MGGVNEQVWLTQEESVSLFSIEELTGQAAGFFVSVLYILCFYKSTCFSPCSSSVC